MTIGIWLNENFNLLKKDSNLRSMDHSEDWAPCSKAVENATISDLTLIFSEAQERLDETIKSKELYFQRSNSLLGISLALLTSIIAYLGARLQHFSFGLINISFTVVGIILIVVCVKSKNNLLPQSFDVKGTLPKNLFKEKYLSNSTENQNQKTLLIALIKDYQARITDNISINTKAASNYRECLNILFYTPVLMLLISILCAIFGISV